MSPESSSEDKGQRTGDKSMAKERSVVVDYAVYLVIRVDPHKVLPAGYGAK